MKEGKEQASGEAVRPQVVREIALWWQGELDRAALAGETPDTPPPEEVMRRFQCSEEEARRGCGLGEHRHFSGID